MLLILLPSKIDLASAFEHPRSCDVASILRFTVESGCRARMDLKLGELFDDAIGFKMRLERAEEEVE